MGRPVKSKLSQAGDKSYTRLEMLRYLNEKDMEAAASRIREDMP